MKGSNHFFTASNIEGHQGESSFLIVSKSICKLVGILIRAGKSYIIIFIIQVQSRDMLVEVATIHYALKKPFDYPSDSVSFFSNFVMSSCVRTVLKPSIPLSL